MSRLGVLLALCVLVAGCAAVSEPADDAGVGSGVPAGPGDVSVTVTRVVDGDTVEVEYPNGTADTVRLVGVDTPEVHAENTPGEFEGVPETAAGRDCLRRWGERASALATERLSGERVVLSFDPDLDRRGYYGRLLAYVRTEGANETFNRRLVASGHARVYDSPFARRDRYDDAEARARREGRGLWGACATDSPATATPGASATVTDGGTTGDGAIAVVEIHEDAAGNDNENLNDEYVVLANRGDAVVSLAGWTVRDEAGKTYTFGDLTLAPGDRVTLHTGSGEDTATDVYWGRQGAVWNNGGDAVTVRDPDGEVVARRSYG